MLLATASDENVSSAAAAGAPNAPVAPTAPTPASTSEPVTAAAAAAAAESSWSSASDHVLCVVLHPPDEGYWLKSTWLLSFAASFAFDGVCLSLILFDARIGMVDSVPPQTRTLEHIATVFLFRYLVGMYHIADDHDLHLFPYHTTNICCPYRATSCPQIFYPYNI